MSGVIGLAIVPGLLAGLVLGFLGAGGAVVGLPLLLWAGLGPHEALGTNALGVALIAAAVLLWQGRRDPERRRLWRPGLAFAAPGLGGIYLGARLGLLVPGQELVVLLGLLFFVVAGWVYFLSTRAQGPESAGARPGRERDRALTGRRLAAIGSSAFAVGTVAGFFGVGGGFMVVPVLAVTAGLGLSEAMAAALLPIAAFTGWIGLQYWQAGEANLPFAAAMLAPGLAGGLAGVALGRRLSKRTSQRALAVFLVLIGLYMLFK